MRNMTIVRAGGICLVVAALGFVGVFTFLAMQFDYPTILDGDAAEVLPRLLATGNTGRAVWALYGFLGLVGMFRNVSDIVGPVAALNNYLLPFWMIIFGVALVRDDGRQADRHASEFQSRQASTP